MEELILASSGTFLIVGLFLAVLNLLEAVFITPQGRKGRLVSNSVISLIMLVIFAGIGLLKPMLAGMEFMIGLATAVLMCAYIVYSAICAVVKIKKANGNKVDSFYQLFTVFILVFAVLYVVFDILRQADIAKYLITDVTSKDYGKFLYVAPDGGRGVYQYITTIPNLPSNNLFLGAGIVFALIAGVGCFVVMLLNMFKTDKHSTVIFLAICLVIVYFVAPAYSATLIQDGMLIKNAKYPPDVSISGASLIFGLQEGVNMNLPLLLVPVLTFITLIVTMVDRAKAESTARTKAVKSVFFILTAVSILLTMAFAQMSLTPEIMEQVDAVVQFSKKYSFTSYTATPFELATVGVSSGVLWCGIGIFVLSALSILNNFIKFVIKYRFLIFGCIGAALVAVSVVSPIITLPGIGMFTGAEILSGIEGISGLGISVILVIVFGALSLIFALLAQRKYTSPFIDEEDWRNWEPVKRIVYENGKWAKGPFSAKLSAICIAVAGVVMFLTPSLISMSLTPAASTVVDIYTSFGQAVQMGQILTVAGIICFVCAAVMMFEWIKGILFGIWKFISKFIAKHILGFACALLSVGALVLVLTGGLVSEGSLTVKYVDNKFIDILTAGPTTNIGQIAQIVVFALVALTVIAVLTFLISDFMKKCKAGYVIKSIGAIALILAGVILIVFNYLAPSLATEGLTVFIEGSPSLVLMGILMIGIAMAAVYKTTVKCAKSLGYAIVNNVGLTATFVAIIIVVLYCMGIIN